MKKKNYKSKVPPELKKRTLCKIKTIKLRNKNLRGQMLDLLRVVKYCRGLSKVRYKDITIKFLDGISGTYGLVEVYGYTLESDKVYWERIKKENSSKQKQETIQEEISASQELTIGDTNNHNQTVYKTQEEHQNI